MSYEILQSTKVFKLVDTKGTKFYAYGIVAESNNCSPKRYDTIYIQRMAHNAEDLISRIVDEAYYIVSGSLQLKNGNGKSVDDDVDTFIRRFLRNIKLAKTVEVEQLEFMPEVNSVKIHAGEIGKANLAKVEPTFRFYDDQLNGRWSVTLQVKDTENQPAIDFLLSEEKSVEDAANLVEDFPYIASLFKGESATEEQFRKLYKHSPQWTFDRVLRKIDKQVREEYLGRMTEEEKQDKNNKW